jgi:hypothetical protein
MEVEILTQSERVSAASRKWFSCRRNWARTAVHNTKVGVQGCSVFPYVNLRYNSHLHATEGRSPRVET